MSTVVEELVAKLSVEGVDQATRDLGGFSGKVEGASSKLMGIAGSLGVAAASAALMNFGDTAAELASGVSESMNKVAVVFGDSGQEVIDFSETTASAMGISQAAALETAGTFGNIFNASGVAQEAAADMSTNLVQLAADLASFNNMEPTEVLDKLRAGLVGEAEPMRALGVLLSEDAVKAKAMEMGLAATTKELTQADKVQARYAIMLEQTSVAQGDFSRTAEGAANSARIANAQYEDMQATIGEKVLPIKMQLLGVMGRLIGLFTSLSPAQQNIIIKIGMLAAVLGPLIAGIGLVMPVLGALGAAFGVLLGPIGLVVAAVAALGLAWATNFGGIQDKTQPVIDAVVNFGKEVVAWLGEKIPPVIETLAAFWTNTLQPALAAVWAFITGSVVPAFQDLLAWLGEKIPPVIETLAAFWTNTLQPALAAVWAFIRDDLMPMFSALADVISAILGVAIEALAGLWQNVLQPALETAWTFLDKKVKPVLQAVADKISAVLGPALTFLADQLEGPIKTALETGKGLLDKIKDAFSGISDKVGKVTSFLKDLADRINGLKLPDWLTPGSPTPLENALAGISDRLRQAAGSDIPAFAGALRALQNMQVSVGVGLPGALPGLAGPGGYGQAGAMATGGEDGATAGRRWVEAYRAAVQEGISGMADELAAAMEPRVDYRYRTRRMGMGALP